MATAPKPASNLQAIVDDIGERMAAEMDRGTVATYIPELAKADLNRFGIAVVTAEGEMAASGDAEMPFSIQSVSKVFTLSLALERVGNELWKRVGREASGNAFNSIVQLEYEHGIPRNPFINAGAIVVADALLENRTVDETIAEILTFIRHAAQDGTIAIDENVLASEIASGHRNRALANYMKAAGNLHNSVEDALTVYFSQCSINMSCRQLAQAGRSLAQTGCGLDGSEARIAIQNARRINALMITCGHYDASGDFAFQVGIPGKSGVGGGILGIVPGKASIAAWCPGLNEKGNSRLASLAFRDLALETGWSIFGPLA